MRVLEQKSTGNKTSQRWAFSKPHRQCKQDGNGMCQPLPKVTFTPSHSVFTLVKRVDVIKGMAT